MNNKIFIGLVVLAAGVLIGWIYFKGKTVSPVTINQAMQGTPTPSGSNLGAPGTVSGVSGNGLEKGGVAARTVVTFTDKGFSPSPVTVKSGTTVTFVNESTGPMWVESSVFNENTSVANGGTYEYTFGKVGTWTYDNHLNPAVKGKIVVIQ
jgi:plastocyanin